MIVHNSYLGIQASNVEHQSLCLCSIIRASSKRCLHHTIREPTNKIPTSEEQVLTLAREAEHMTPSSARDRDTTVLIE